MKKVLLGLALLILLGLGGLFGSKQYTVNRGDELSMALDNLNPLVKVETVYGLTNTAVNHTKGQMGEDVYLYKMQTVNAHGQQRQLTFNADHRLKQRHYLKIETKGQNVNSWEAVPSTAVPTAIQKTLAAS